MNLYCSTLTFPCSRCQRFALKGHHRSSGNIHKLFFPLLKPNVTVIIEKGSVFQRQWQSFIVFLKKGWEDPIIRQISKSFALFGYLCSGSNLAYLIMTNG
ncbi:hypothetical protein XELAEV_18013738mg [Xenopus laevis]|uniref:Uncharacterized protein n=1 Tax=Xenopus laevis TaxID=8355 RepID=A0A974DRW1_XENLA|nr:hypothetical protein XELAEV_18013738mg [Xenopus laevis]